MVGITLVIFNAGADDEISNVGDDAKSSSNDQQCANDSRLTMTILFHNGRRLNDVHWLRHYMCTCLLDHYLLMLLRLRLHLDALQCFYADMYTDNNASTTADCDKILFRLSTI